MPAEESQPEVAAFISSDVQMETLKFRAYRNSLIDMLTLPVNTYPLPDTPLSASQAVVQYEQPGTIILSYSQPEVSYQIFDQTKGKPIDINNTTDEDNGVIATNTQPLTEEDYTFSVLATKTNKPEIPVSISLLQTVLIKVGIKKDLALEVAPVQYGAQAVVIVKEAQRGTMYQLFDPLNNPLSVATNSGAGGDLPVSTYLPLYEDVTVSVKSTNIKTGQNGMLDKQANILVYPNTASKPGLISAVADYKGSNSVTLPLTQKSALYQLRFQDIDDDTVDKELQKDNHIGEPVSGNGSMIELPVSMLTEDLTINILAIKTPSGLQQQLPSIKAIPVKPDISQQISVVETNLKPGDTATIRVSKTQRGVKYQLRTADGVNVGNPAYHHKNYGIGKAHIEVDFVIDTFTDDFVQLSTGRLEQTTTFNVLATKPTTGVSAQLTNTITVEVTKVV